MTTCCLLSYNLELIMQPNSPIDLKIREELAGNKLPCRLGIIEQFGSELVLSGVRLVNVFENSVFFVDIGYGITIVE